jgi:hypothetical protein
LPGAGSVGEQDARLMAALEYVRDVENEQLARELRRRRKDPDAELDELRTEH